MRIIYYIPWIYITLFYSFVFRTYLDFGKMPGLGNPDPTNLYISHQKFVDISFMISTIGSVIVLLWIIINPKKNIFKKDGILFFIGFVILIYIILFDSFFAWYLD
jgi:hypothetical protein